MHFTTADRTRFAALLAKRSVAGPNGCIEYSQALRTDGYGQVNVRLRGEHKLFAAHRLAWICANGRIDSAQLVLHNCDNRKCFNLDHLYVGTYHDNAKDARDRGRNKGSTLSVAIVLAIRSLAANHSRRTLAETFNITPSTVGSVISRRTWKHV